MSSMSSGSLGQTTARIDNLAKTVDVELTDADRQLIEKLLGNPREWPDSTKSWLTDYIAVNIPQIPISQIVGFRTARLTKAQFRTVTPYDGQVVTITDIDGSIEWTFVYDQSVTDAYKWKFLYGQPIFSRYDPSQGGSAASGVWTDYANGPSKTIDQKGYYSIDIGARGDAGGAAAISYTGVSVGGAAPTFYISISWSDNSCGYSSQSPVEVSANNTVVKMQHQDADSARRLTSGLRFMRLTPIRIGQ